MFDDKKKMMFLLKYSFCFSFAIFHFVSAYSNKSKTTDDIFMRYLNETYTDLCPHMELCSKADYVNLTDKLPCSCRSDCYLYDGCCHDSARQNQETLDCSAFVYHMTGKALSFINGYNYGINMYHQVTTCALDFPHNTETFDMCVNDKNAIEFEDVVTVSDADGNVYKNQHCAICNNVTNYIWFDLHIYCKERLSNVAFEVTNMTSLFETSCYIWSKPPQPEIGRQSRCFKADVTSCNETGLWDKYDTNMDKACNSFTMLYTHKAYHVISYKNVYCFLCNHKHDHMDHREATCLFDDIEIPKFADLALSAILNFKLLSTEPKRQIKEPRCSKGFYDFHFDICRDVVCPMGSIMAGDKCIELYKRIVGWTFQLFFHITPTEVVDVKKDMDNIANAAINNFGIFNIGCRLCRYLLLTNASVINPSALTLMLLLESNEEFSFERASKRMQELRQNSPTFSVVLNNGNVNYISIHLATEINTMDAVQSKNIKGVNVKSRCLYSTNILSSTTFCPKLEMSSDDFKSLKEHKGISDTDIRTLSVFEDQHHSCHNVNELTNKTDMIEICVDDYKRIINNISSATSNVYQVYGTYIVITTASLPVLMSVRRWL